MPAGLYFSLKYFFFHCYHTPCLQRHSLQWHNLFGPFNDVITEVNSTGEWGMCQLYGKVGKSLGQSSNSIVETGQISSNIPIYSFFPTFTSASTWSRLSPWRWRKYISQNYLNIQALHGEETQKKTTNRSSTTIKISGPTKFHDTSTIPCFFHPLRFD